MGIQLLQLDNDNFFDDKFKRNWNFSHSAVQVQLQVHSNVCFFLQIYNVSNVLFNTCT